MDSHETNIVCEIKDKSDDIVIDRIESLFYNSILISIIILALLSGFHNNYIHEQLASVTYIYDLVQLMSLLIVIILAYVLFQKRSSSTVIFIAMLATLMIIQVASESRVSEYYFDKPISDDSLDEPFVTMKIKEKLSGIGIGDDERNSSCYSGFTFRQWFLTLISYYLLFNLKPKDIRNSHKKILMVYFPLAILYVAMGRLSRTHTPEDIASGIALASITFWTLLFSWKRLYHTKVGLVLRKYQISTTCDNNTHFMVRKLLGTHITSTIFFFVILVGISSKFEALIYSLFAISIYHFILFNYFENYCKVVSLRK